MISFKSNQRVKVLREESGIGLSALGTVERVCSDGRVWIALDERSKVTKAHPFDASDSRGRLVRAHPDDCEVATENRGGRREATREAARVEPGTVPIASFGRDHWSTLAYIETRWVDGADGSIAIEKMRCRRDRPLLAHYGGSQGKLSPTRLHDGTELAEHDDWDCVADMVAAGLLEEIGTGASPRFSLTERGLDVVAQLRRFKARGGSTSTFVADQPGSLVTLQDEPSSTSRLT